MTGDSEFKFSYWDWLKATDDNWDMLFSVDKLGPIDDEGYVRADSMPYGKDTGWELVCLYDEKLDNDLFKRVCDPTVPSRRPGLSRLQRCPNRTKCMPEQNPQWPSIVETRKAINEMQSYRRATPNTVFNKHNTGSFSKYLEGWDPPALPSTECTRDELLCGEDNIPRRLHNLVRTIYIYKIHSYDHNYNITHSLITASIIIHAVPFTCILAWLLLYA